MIPYAFVSISTLSTEYPSEVEPHTEVIRYDQFVQKLVKPQNAELMKAHAAMGIAGEAGELADAIKRDIIYEASKTPEGKSIRDAVIEEIGDCQWYLQLAMLLYDITPQEVFQTNADKLSQRYVKLTYSDREAATRADKKE